jgi:hypothetical protein
MNEVEVDKILPIPPALMAGDLNCKSPFWNSRRENANKEVC